MASVNRKRIPASCGTTAMYKKGCKCLECKAAIAEYARKYYLGYRKRTPAICGTTAMYEKGCRCTECKAADNIYQVARTHGICIEQAAELRQTSHCELCGITFGNITVSIDHSHETGKVRGALCNRCNVILGLFENERIGPEVGKWLEQIGLATVKSYIERGV